MRNRSNTPPRSEDAFIHGGTAGVDKTLKQSDKLQVVNKAKPVSISFFETNLQDIDEIIREEMLSGRPRVNRSDIVRAAVKSLKNLSKTEISRLISGVKHK